MNWALLPATLTFYGGTYLLFIVFIIFFPLAIGCLPFIFIYACVDLSVYVFGENFISVAIGLIPTVLAVIKFASLSEEARLKFENTYDDVYMAIGSVFETIIGWLKKRLPFKNN